MTRIPSMGEEGKTIKAGITVKNQSAWNMRYEAVILVGNKIEEKKKQKRIRGVIQAENVRTFWYELPGNICGIPRSASVYPHPASGTVIVPPNREPEKIYDR